MKREILCPPCRQSLVGKLGSYPGEGEKAVEGISKRNVVCDNCMKPLPPGTRCFAFSLWSERAPYFEWEHEYIDY